MTLKAKFDKSPVTASTLEDIEDMLLERNLGFPSKPEGASEEEIYRPALPPRVAHLSLEALGDLLNNYAAYLGYITGVHAAYVVLTKNLKISITDRKKLIRSELICTEKAKDDRVAANPEIRSLQKQYIEAENRRDLLDKLAEILKLFHQTTSRQIARVTAEQETENRTYNAPKAHNTLARLKNKR